VERRAASSYGSTDLQIWPSGYCSIKSDRSTGHSTTSRAWQLGGAGVEHIVPSKYQYVMNGGDKTLFERSGELLEIGNSISMIICRTLWS